MSQKPIMQSVANIVQELENFSSEDRHRIIRASLTLLGEALASGSSDIDDAESDENPIIRLPAKARNWMKQNGVTIEQIGEVFHFGDEGAEIIAAIPGATRKEQVRNAYVLCGIGRLLTSGETKFDDRAARGVCELGGFFDSTNHMKYMKGREFTGSRDKGWVLTAPGLKRAASLLDELSKD